MVCLVLLVYLVLKVNQDSPVFQVFQDQKESQAIVVNQVCFYFSIHFQYNRSICLKVSLVVMVIRVDQDPKDSVNICI